MGAPIGKPAEGKDPVGCSVMHVDRAVS